MWVFLPAVSLAIVHIAGDNLAVVPDMAAVLGPGIYITTMVAYLFFGVFITGISAWIGVNTGQELIVAVRRIFGCSGKRMMAFVILASCIPASALTGGYFSGWIIHSMIGVPHIYASFGCILLYALLAAGWGRELLHFSNYLALLLFPALLVMSVPIAFEMKGSAELLRWGDIHWPLVLALVGYNAGGMRPALVVEAAACLMRKKNQAVLLAIVAKLVEGAITLLLAYVVLVSGVQGPMALTEAVGISFGMQGKVILNILIFSTFINTMVPAMMVNTRQIGNLTGLSCRPARS